MICFLHQKTHRVAHESQRRGGFCYYYYTTDSETVNNNLRVIKLFEVMFVSGGKYTSDCP